MTFCAEIWLDLKLRIAIFGNVSVTNSSFLTPFNHCFYEVYQFPLKCNVYDNFNVLRGQKPQKEYILGIIPDYLDITYSLSIFTDYVDQANEITEAIEFSARSYWGDPERFMFRANIDTFNTPVLLENGSDRANKTTMNVLVNGYIIPSGINAAMAGPSPKSYSVTKTSFKETII